MSVNFTNASHPSSNSSLPPNMLPCSDPVGIAMLSTAASTYSLLVIPLAVFILYLGSQKWRRQRSVSTAAVMSHSDFFTYNMAVIELIALYGYTTLCFYNYSSYTGIPLWSSVGAFIMRFIWFAQILFLILTCMELYLAVVHPVTYLGLKQAGGVRMRNITTGCVWLMCLGVAGFLALGRNNSVLTANSMLTLSLVVMTFCSLSVLRGLIRSRPGEVGGDRVKIDQSKLRAIHTITIIMGVLWLKFGGNLVSIIIIRSSVNKNVRCLGEALTFVFSLPSSLLLFVLYLHRAGKWSCRKMSPVTEI